MMFDRGSPQHTLSLVACILSVCLAAQARAGTPKLEAGAFPAIATVDPRFQSYNIEMAQVIGGRFWAPYPPVDAPQQAAQPGSGSDPTAGLFQQREPIDLGNRRLRNLARALGPAYVRVSGTWANSAYFQDNDLPRPAIPPKGFQGVLTRAQWAGVVRFAKSADARLVISFASSEGARDEGGAWSPAEARKLLRFTRAIGGNIHAAELINEPNLPAGLPARYDGAQFARDIAIFRNFAANEASGLKVVGPGSAGETGAQLMSHISTEQLLSGEPKPRFDIFSYHFYGKRSERCARIFKGETIGAADALSEAWLERSATAFAYYKAHRDRFAPGAPIWLSETAQASCGGDRLASTFLDTFRYVDQMGRLAKQGASAVFHNTLSATDCGLIDADNTPRPSYWAAVLWRHLMGATVLDAGAIRPNLHLYAHCLAGRRGGVAVVAINLDRSEEKHLALPAAARRYTLTSDVLESKNVRLNGRAVAVLPNDRLPPLGSVEARGTVALPAASITFLAFPNIANHACT